MSTIQDTIKLAQTWLDPKNSGHYDPHMANYILRDTQEIEAAGLNDLSWLMHKEGYCVQSEVEHLIKELEKHLAN